MTICDKMVTSEKLHRILEKETKHEYFRTVKK